MKNKFSFLVIVLLSIPLVLGASVTITDDFESYSAGDLTGGSGGSGWTSNWPAIGSCDTQFEVVTTPVNGGTKAAGDITGQSGGCGYRSFTGTNAGEFYISMVRTAVARNGGGFQMRSSAGAVIYCTYRATSIIACANQATGTYEDVGCGTVTANTWYRVGVKWDDAAQNDKFAVNCNNGSWTAWKTAYADMASVDGLMLYGSNYLGDYVYYDDISPTYVAVSSSASPATSTTIIGRNSTLKGTTGTISGH